MAVSDYDRSRYLDWNEIEAHLAALAESAPGWVSLETIGQSRQGRALWLLTIGALNDAPDDKPGFWLDGGTHAAEWTGVMSALDSATRWVASLRSGDESARAWFEAHTVYVMPCVSPDGFVAMRSGGPFLRSTLRGPRDGRPRRGLTAQDIDGDGAIRTMRWRHPGGTWIFDDAKNPAKPRLRTLDDDPAEAYYVADEGIFLEWDGVRWLEASREHGVDLNRNFPASWAPFEMFGMDSGDYALSEPESRALVEAFRKRPRIAAAITNHTYTGCVLSHPYRDPSPLSQGDIRMLKYLADGLVQDTGYRVFKIHPDFTYDKNQTVVGVWSDTLATTFGVAGYTLELWDPLKFAGLQVDKPVELFQEPDVELLGKLLDAFFEEPGSIAPWKTFEHPQLGQVELGGLEYQITVRNPPPRLLPEELDRGFTVADRMRRSLPAVEATLTTEALGGDVHRVELVVENLGYLPSGSLRHAEKIGVAPPVVATLSAGDDNELVEGLAQRELGWLDGWGSLQAGPARHPIYTGLPLERGQRARATWVVRGSGRIQVSWDAGRAGRGDQTHEL